MMPPTNLPRDDATPVPVHLPPPAAATCASVCSVAEQAVVSISSGVVVVLTASSPRATASLAAPSGCDCAALVHLGFGPGLCGNDSEMLPGQGLSPDTPPQDPYITGYTSCCRRLRPGG